MAKVSGTQKAKSSYYIGTIVEVLFMFILPMFVNPWAEGITETGVAITLIFIGEIIGIIATNDLITSGFLPWRLW